MTDVAKDIIDATTARVLLPAGTWPSKCDDASREEISATLLAMMAGAARLARELDEYRALLAVSAYEHGATTDQIGATDGITGEGARRKWKLPPRSRGTGKRVPATKVAEGVASENGA